MTLLAPERLGLLAAVALLALTYIVMQLRGSRYALRFTNLELLESVAPRRAAWRRHLLAGAFLVAVAALVVALARPARTVEVARERSTIILAIDTSISMRATDVAPSRLDAARAAANDFIDLLPDTIDLGIVSFDGAARTEARPTHDPQALKRSVDGLQLGPGTAIGEAIFLGLDSLQSATEERTIATGSSEVSEEPAGHIIVMSDGETTAGRPNAEAVDAAKRNSIPVSTIAYGTGAGTVVHEGETIPVPVNTVALQQVAEGTGGTFFEAVSGEELQQAFEDIGSAIAFETEQRELALWFVGLGLLLAVAAGGGSLFWFSRLP